jgi:hypothetical protein
MFAYLRSFLSSIVILSCIPVSPGHSDPIASLAGPKDGTERTAAVAASQETCLSRPGKSVEAGQRWVYHREGQRRCWFQTAELAQLKKRVRYRPTKAVVAASEERERKLSRPKRVEDARAELVPSRLEAPQAEPTASSLDVASPAPAPDAKRATLLTGELDRAELETRAGRRPGADLSLADAPPQRVASLASMVAGTQPVHSTSETPDDSPSWPATWIAVLLMSLGVGSVLASNGAVRNMIMSRYKAADV